MKKFLVSLFALAFIFTAAPAFSGDIELAKKSTLESIVKAGKIRVGFESGYLPFEMTNTKGQYIGFDIDMAKQLAKAMKVKFAPVNTAWDGIIPGLLTDKYDVIISGMTLTQERNLAVNFTDPYIVVGQAILVNNKHKGTVNSYKDLNDPKYVICSKLGTTGEQAIKRLIPKATYKSFEVESEACMEVIQGNADATVYDLPLIEFFQATHGKGKTFALTKPFTFEPLAMAIKKGDPDFLNFLNNFIRQYKNDGRWQKSYDKWIKSNKWQKDLAAE
ncbi:MAG: transporter substrate-binding domain-containing protein [Desulfobacter sp.]